MLNAILADDEPIIIKGLKKLIPWQDLGIQIVGEAMTGRGLLELIEQLHPDLVVTDISMPDGSGIDVIKEIQKKQLRTKVIFISAYQEFSYAKDALAFGAVEYLVKPIERNLLLEAVNKAMTLLQVETEGQSSKGKLAVYEQKDKKTQTEELFDRLTEGDILGDEAERKLQALGIEAAGPWFSVFMIELEHVQAEDDRWGEHEKRLILFAISNMADELIEPYGGGMVIRKAENLCVIIHHKDAGGMLSLAQEMLDKILFYLKIHVTISIGESVTALMGIKHAYTTAAQTLKFSYFNQRGAVIPWVTSSQETLQTEWQLAELTQQLLQALMAKEKERLMLSLTALFQHVEALSKGSKEAAVTSCYSMLMELAEELAEVGITAGASVREREDWLGIMHQFHRYADLISFVTDRAVEMLEQLQIAGGSKEVQQMKFVKAFIEEHYDENITLESMASKVYMNSYYFSSFFKKHTNENFKQYVTNIRMKHAVRLLLQTDLMVYEIAEQVGYNNARQFSDMFKKCYGKLPQEYKNQKS